MKTFYFTATGNSLYAAQRIGGELNSIPQMLKERRSEFSDDVIGFVFPCYAFGLPNIVANFIQHTTLRADYFFAVMTYGNMAAAGLKHLEKIAHQAGIKVDYSNELLMIDNYLPMFKMEEQRNSEAVKNIDERLDIIVSDIQQRQQKHIRKGVPSVILSPLIHYLFSKSLATSDKHFLVNTQCNGCKVCEKVCPRKNITVTETPAFSHHCEGCLACIHNCPQRAIHLKSERSDARFINQNVTLTDIIAANNQR